eukprot:TRINITY_DN66116_c0_g1_i1.p1 TRINITY_DN66116_c0_g1~~TRINITY_DN66116_c0_g1_i1.p1  ORF type:complete len:288 (+),score=86.29 TRINITY_DN66116_c0_g1_i1:73-864(+)
MAVARPAAGALATVGSWQKAAWTQGRGAGLVRGRLAADNLEPRFATPQTTPVLRQFLDKYAEWPVLDDRSKAAGLPWRSRFGRVRSCTDKHPGLRGWDTRELSRDVPPPEFTLEMLTRGSQVGLWSVHPNSPEELQGCVCYQTDFEDDSEEAGESEKRANIYSVCIAPSLRWQGKASMLMLGALDDCRQAGCKVCYITLLEEDRLVRPYLLPWLQNLEFSKVAKNRNGTLLSNTAFAKETFIENLLPPDEDAEELGRLPERTV